MIDKPSWWNVQYIANSDGYKHNGPITGPKGLLVHSTAWPGKDAQGIRDYFNATGRGASIHGALDDVRFIQTMPFTQKAGHVGSGLKGTLNTSFLGIEICEPSGIKYNKAGSAIEVYNPPAGYFDSVRAKAVHLYAYLCQEYNTTPSSTTRQGAFWRTTRPMRWGTEITTPISAIGGKSGKSTRWKCSGRMCTNLCRRKTK